MKNHDDIADNCIAKLDFRKIMHVIEKAELEHDGRIMDLAEVVTAARELILEILSSNEDYIRKSNKGFVAIKDKGHITIQFVIDACKESTEE